MRYSRVGRLAASLFVTAALLIGVAPVGPEPQVAAAALPNATLYAVTFVPNSNVLVAVGASGTIVRSQDGGVSWNHVVNVPGSALTETLRGVSFIDEHRGWAISHAGVLLYTVDGGNSWVREYSGTIFGSQDSGAMFDLKVVKETLSSGSGHTGLAAGRPLSFTAPATVRMSSHAPRPASLYGEWTASFAAQEYMETGDFTEPIWVGTGEFYSLDVWMGATNPERVWVAGRDRYGGRNDGAVWTEAYASASRFNTNAWVRQDKTKFTGSGPLYGISFGTVSTGVVVGTAGKAWRTTDGGSTWTAVASTDVTADLNAVAMTDANWGWAVAASGQVTRTENGGLTWTARSLGSGSLEDVASLGGGSKVAVAVGAHGRIMRTSDGVEWVQVGEAPTGTITINNAATYTTSRDVTVSHTVSGGSGGIAQMRHSADGGSTWIGGGQGWVTYAPSRSITLPSGDGTKTVRVEFKDAVGTVSTELIEDSIILDTTAPTGTIAIDGGAPYATSTAVTVTNSVNFDVSGAHATQGMRFSTDGGSTWSAWETYKASKSLTLPSGDGTKTVRGEFKDAAGNVATLSDTIVVDTTAPTGTISINSDALYTASANVTVSSSVTWGASGPNPAQAMRFYNGSTWSAWESYAATKSLTLTAGDGTKTVTAEFRDAAGNTSAAPISDTIVLDTTRPTGTISINDGAAYTATRDVTVSSSVTWGASGPNPAQAMRFHDGATWSAWEPYAATKALTLTDVNGTKTVTAEFRDAAGNTSNTTISDTIILDDTVPAVTGLTATPHGSAGAWNASTSPTLSWNATPGALGYSYSWSQSAGVEPDEQADTTATSVSYTGVADGTWYFKVRAQGATGIWGPPSSLQVRIDSTAPTGSIAINSGALSTASANVTVTNSINFAVSGAHPAGGMRFKIGEGDWSAWQPFESTKSLTLPAPDGVKTVYAEFKDAAGNTLARSASITLDTTRPTGTVSINSGAQTTNSTDVTVAHTVVWGASGGGQMRHSTDGGTTWVGGGDGWVTYAASKALTLPAGDGTKTVHAQFRDNAGNLSLPGTISDTIELDTSVASFTIHHHDAGVTFDRFVTDYNAAYSGGGYVYGRWTDTRMLVRFSGSSIRWYGPKQPNYGRASVYVDGQYKGTADAYASSAEKTLNAEVFKVEGLTDGPHVMEIRLTGQKNPASTGYIVVVDYFEVDGAAPTGGGTRHDEATGTLSGPWIYGRNRAYIGYGYHYSKYTTATFTKTFTGTKVAWIGPKTGNYGRAQVWIDGAYQGVVSQYGTMGWRERVWESKTLSPGTHTITIKPTGTKDAAPSSSRRALLNHRHRCDRRDAVGHSLRWQGLGNRAWGSSSDRGLAAHPFSRLHLTGPPRRSPSPTFRACRHRASPVTRGRCRSSVSAESRR
jgi:photosystem II stability/assembly factor-like uncharacterized protein